MPINSELVSVIIALATSILGTVASYGAMRSRQDRMEKDLEEFVPSEVFKVHIAKIEQDLAEIKKDVRILLMHTMNAKKEP